MHFSATYTDLYMWLLSTAIRPFRKKWPWEQDRQMAVYNRTPEHIQIASHPSSFSMAHRAGVHDWCLSHLPGSGCFISHHCENKKSKNNLIKLYTLTQAQADVARRGYAGKRGDRFHFHVNIVDSL